MNAAPGNDPYAAARAAQADWEQTPVDQRARLLGRVADRLVARADALAALVVEENGKPGVEALAHDILPSVQLLRWLETDAAAVLADRLQPLRWMPTRRAVIRRRPFGVALVITPWNFPLAIPLAGVATALAAGNAVVLKPSEVTPRCADALLDLFEPLPPGLLTVVHGDGERGAALVDAGPDKVFFTGSLAAGRAVMARAARHPVPVSLELGGVDALIVCNDADLELAASAATWGATCNTGQVCASVERLLVQRSVAEELRQRLLDKFDRVALHRDQGTPTLPRQVEVWRHHLDDATRRGLTVEGGWRPDPGGARLRPTLIHGDDPLRSQVWTEESFGPILALVPFDDDDDARRLHDAAGMGITASVFSRDPDRARRLAGRLRAGLVSINDVAATLYGHGELPWGGVGRSGFGRSKGAEGLREATWTQVIDEPRAPGIEPKKPWWYPYDHHQYAVIRQFLTLVGARSPLGRATAAAAITRAGARLLARSPRL